MIASEQVFAAQIYGDMDQKFGGGGSTSGSYSLDDTLLLFPGSASSASYSLQEGGIGVAISDPPAPTPPVSPETPITPDTPTPPGSGGSTPNTPYTGPDGYWHDKNTEPEDEEQSPVQGDYVFGGDQNGRIDFGDVVITRPPVSVEPEVNEIDTTAPEIIAEIPYIPGGGGGIVPPGDQWGDNGICTFEVMTRDSFNRQICPISLRASASEHVGSVVGFLLLIQQMEQGLLFLGLLLLILLLIALAHLIVVYREYTRE